MGQRLHEKRPDLYPKPVSDCCGHVVWHGTFEDIFPKVVREKIVDFAIKEGLADDPGVSGGIAALKEYDRWCEKMLGPKRAKTPDLGFVQPFCKIELNNEKEKEKMNAKKCERCGKLYEMKDADDYTSVYMPGLPVSDWNKENFTESRIRKDNTRTISVNFRGGEVVDLCPECRKKLKHFFECGDMIGTPIDETTVIKKAEE